MPLFGVIIFENLKRKIFSLQGFFQGAKMTVQVEFVSLVLCIDDRRNPVRVRQGPDD